MKPAIFLDKDGTLIPNIPYNVNPDLISLYAGTGQLATLQKKGFLIIIVSNQAGVAKGLFSEKDLIPVKDKITNLLLKDGVQLNGFYYCPHHPEGSAKEFSRVCNCRKPMPGMLYKAANDLNIDLANSWMVGDILNDIEAGNRASCKSILINNGNETEWETGLYRNPFFEAANFDGALQFIIRSTAMEIYERPMGQL